MSVMHNTGFTALAAGAALIVSMSAAAGDTAAREQAAGQATQQLLQQLGAALKRQMGSEGPESAIAVCRDLAPQIAGELSRANG